MNESMLGYLFTVAGLIFFFEGLPYLASPEGLKKFLNKVSCMPCLYLRILGGGLMLLGLACVYWGRHNGG